LLEVLRGGLTPPETPATDKALLGRRGECAALDQLLEAVRGGESRALVVRGEAGVGKTALLDYVVDRAAGCRVVRAAGVQSEMELAFAGLQQLCAPLLDRLEGLPGPHRDALGTALGLTSGRAPDRLLVGLAVLGLLSEAAGDRPLVCVVDDAQWLDRASAQALAFVARRLLAESVALVFVVGAEERELAGLPELVVEGLDDRDAQALLASVFIGPLDERVRDRILAETRGNPLALLELPRGLSAAELAGGFGLPVALPLSGRIEEHFRRRLIGLPAPTRRLLLVAAAEPVGDPLRVWGAARRLGIGTDAAAAAAGLAEFGARVRFRHPLVRSAVYRAASIQERQFVHAALAQATDRDLDPDRRAWHLAQAATGPDEDVAWELERSAGRAQGRGGLAAAAAFLEQAAGLTLEPGLRARRALAAARAKHQAGAPDAALGLLALAEAGPLDELQRARAQLLRGQIAFALSHGSDAPPLLLDAARKFEPLDVGMAREAYLEALSAATFVGCLDRGCGLLEVAQAARLAPPSPQPHAADLLLDGLALLITEGHAVGTPMLQRALRAFADEELSTSEDISWLWLACHAAAVLWDDQTLDLLSARHVELARTAGALTVLPLALTSRVGVHVHAGELTEPRALIEEVEAVIEATGSQLAPYGALGVAAWQGKEAQARELIEAAAEEVIPRGEGMGLTVIHYSTAVLCNGLGRYEDALAAAQLATEHGGELRFSTWALIELVEAATRTGDPERARDALRRLAATTHASGSDWGLGVEARSRALLCEGQEAEDLYREAIDRLGRTRVPVALARAHLLYGEWLRRERRRVDAREQLRLAHGMFLAMGLEAFAKRAARELLATGETARKRTADTSDQLTAQETQIARLARDGLSNPEIASQLFISPRTVEYHLHKVFAKLNISSRNELERVLGGDPMVERPMTSAMRRALSPSSPT
jgi:DNA-binding CsgD family transcriptional regulator